MRKCLVTGASGHLGVALLRKLKKQNEFVRVIIRSKECLSYIGELVDEVYYGDITDLDSLLNASKDIDVVFHLAALITVGNEQKEDVYNINYLGTKNVVDSCLENNVKKLVYVSSAHAIDFKTKKEVIGERDRLNPDKVKGNYAKSKAMATNLVLEANSSALETVVLLPTAIIGPYAYKETHFNKFLEMFSKNKMRFYLKGSYNFIDVRDTAEAVYNASIISCGGKTYILSGEVMNIKEILFFLSSSRSKKKPLLKVPLLVVHSVIPLFGAYYKISRSKPLFTSHTIYTLNSNPNFDNSKAITELSLNVRSAKESLLEHYDFLVKK